MSKKIAIVGAGISGVLTAYYAAKKGYKVTVFEQERYAGMKTSFANGGQISVSNSEVWTTHTNVKKGIKWLFTKDAPLLIRPKFDFNQWKWIAKFLYYTYTNKYEENTSETIRMGLEAQDLYKQLIESEPELEFDRSASGILHFYKTGSYWNNAKTVKEIYNQNGCQWDLLNLKQIQQKDNTLSNIKNIIGGAWTEHDWTGDIHRFTYGLAKLLQTKYKVKFIYNYPIHTVDTLGNFDRIILANGVGSTKLAKTAGDTIDVYPVKGYSITINNVDPKYLPKVSLLDDEAKIVTASLGNKFRVAGTAELAGENYDIRRDRIEPLLNWVHTNFPKINTHDYTQWACLRPMTPNMMPITKQSDNNYKVYYNTGHGHLGWTLGPYTAKKVVDLL